MRPISLATMLLFLVTLCSCAPQETVSGDAKPAVSPTTTDPVSGKWSGDWGPSSDYRNIVTMDLTWDGTNLMGTVNPGPNAIAITTGSFAADTGILKLEANGNGDDGKTRHYTMEGQLMDGVVSGTWMDGDKKNDFRIKKS